MFYYFHGGCSPIRERALRINVERHEKAIEADTDLDIFEIFTV